VHTATASAAARHTLHGQNRAVAAAVPTAPALAAASPSAPASGSAVCAWLLLLLLLWWRPPSSPQLDARLVHQYSAPETQQAEVLAANENSLGEAVGYKQSHNTTVTGQEQAVVIFESAYSCFRQVPAPNPAATFAHC
jgi:hypothetical protein